MKSHKYKGLSSSPKHWGFLVSWKIVQNQRDIYRTKSIPWNLKLVSSLPEPQLSQSRFIQRIYFTMQFLTFASTFVAIFPSIIAVDTNPYNTSAGALASNYPGGLDFYSNCWEVKGCKWEQAVDNFNVPISNANQCSCNKNPDKWEYVSSFPSFTLLSLWYSGLIQLQWYHLVLHKTGLHWWPFQRFWPLWRVSGPPHALETQDRVFSACPIASSYLPYLHTTGVWWRCWYLCYTG